MKFNLLILILLSIESLQTRNDGLGYAKKFIINKEMNDFSESIYDFCLYYQSILKSNNMSKCNVMYHFFFLYNFFLLERFCQSINLIINREFSH